MTDLVDRPPAIGEPQAGETKGERTRRRLLQLAIERFGERGYRRTSVSEIARQAGVTQAAAYAYFEGKEDLFVAAVDADATQLIADAHDAVAALPLHQMFPAFIASLRAGIEQHPLARRVLSGREPDVLGRLVELPAMHAITAQLKDRVRAAQADGQVRDDVDAERLCAGIEAIVVALLLSVVQIGGTPTRRHQVGVVEAFECLLRPV
jgi:AcrR family transcriptional regulator